MTNSAAEHLENRTLEGGWVVKKKISITNRNNKYTGGNFSVGYEVEKDGKVAFLKALDFSKAFAGTGDLAVALERMTSEFNYERNILETCRDARIKKVVRLLSYGEEVVEKSDSPGKTSYLIFEWAESDVRKETVNSSDVGHVWKLRCMHGITSGLYQLHQKQIIHQDIKPSNILSFGEGDVKIGDFGRSYSANQRGVEYNKNIFPGDKTYAPPEILYDYATGPDEKIRKSTDVYMLGSMLHFLFTQSPLTAKIIQKLPPQLHENNGQYSKCQIEPYLQTSYDEVIEEFEQYVQKNIRSEVTDILKQLTNLDPEKRGHPRTRLSHTDNISLERYINIFDRLSRQCAFANRRAGK